MKNDRILLTGGCGLIGAAVCKSLNEKGYENITIVDRLGKSDKWKNLLGLSFKEYVELSEFYQFGLSHYGDFDYIIHMGACSYTTELDSEYLYHNNYQTSFKLLRYVSNINQKCRLIYASSAATYGQIEELSEDIDINSLHPLNPYGYFKHLFDLTVAKYPNVNAVGLKYTNCYDEQTELLTKNGFKFIKDVTLSDEVATLNPNTNYIEYYNPTHVHKIRHKGSMIYFDGRRIDILCTPDQNLYLSKRSDPNSYSLIPASEVIKKNYYQAIIKTTALWNGKEQEYHIIPACYTVTGKIHKKHQEKRIPMEKWMTFMGWFLSEGCILTGKYLRKGREEKYYRINISQISNKDYIEEIYQLCYEMGFSPQRVYRKNKKTNLYNEACGITIHSKQLCLHLKDFYKHKFIPRDLLELSSRLLEFLYISLQKGDGNKGSKQRYNTIYEDFADQFQELLLKTGRYGRKRKEAGVYNGKPHYMYRLDIPKNNWPQLGNCENQKVNFSIIPWDDWVYDITVPNHVIFIRRNGFACWSGNCFGPGENHKGEMQSIISKGFKQIQETGTLSLFSMPDRPIGRDFLYVKDAADITTWFLDDERGKQCRGLYNVGSGIATSWDVMASSLFKALEQPININYIALPEHLIGKYQYWTRADISKLRSAGYDKELFSIHSAIKDYVHNYLLPDKRIAT